MKGYLVISGIIFSLVALAHLLRLLNHWDVVIGPWNAPMFLSWGGLIVPGCLAAWAFRLAGQVK